MLENIPDTSSILSEEQKELMPWLEESPESCRKNKTR